MVGNRRFDTCICVILNLKKCMVTTGLLTNYSDEHRHAFKYAARLHRHRCRRWRQPLRQRCQPRVPAPVDLSKLVPRLRHTRKARVPRAGVRRRKLRYAPVPTTTSTQYRCRVETPRRSVKIRPMYHYFTKEVECNMVPKSRTCCSRGRPSACLQIRAERELAAHARRITLLVVAPCPMEGHCASERPLPFGARLCCDVPAAASNARSVCTCAHTRL